MVHFIQEICISKSDLELEDGEEGDGVGGRGGVCFALLSLDRDPAVSIFTSLT
jgi:hypothetical protein